MIVIVFIMAGTMCAHENESRVLDIMKLELQRLRGVKCVLDTDSGYSK